MNAVSVDNDNKWSIKMTATGNRSNIINDYSTQARRKIQYNELVYCVEKTELADDFSTLRV